MVKIRVTGMRSHNRLMLSGLNDQGVKVRDIPPYFTIEIDTDTIKPRKKSKCQNNNKKSET